jgi:hypothetical protein
MYKVGDKVVILSVNETAGEENFKYYSVIDWVLIKEGWDVYTVWGKKINPDITIKCTEEEIKEFYN